MVTENVVAKTIGPYGPAPPGPVACKSDCVQLLILEARLVMVYLGSGHQSQKCTSAMWFDL